ncbi:ABC transporter permease [Pedobacter psychrophilus]|uniref:ABC transporter permease n=1 Tax=Pedobacter psychrophilus TaxID=1826909 RepID=A0A179DFZ7_9SPHI|nr:FtsX-like permease family protein [Pedobacter psychrophilus]OAQ39951.1 ABC transporter permease [Pedobacter psychrophilus]
MNLGLFIANRISLKAERTFSKLIVRIAIVGIMLGLGVMILSLAIVKGFKAEIREKVRGFNGDIQFIKYDLNSSYENSPFTLQQKYLEDAKKEKGVEHIVPFATKPGIIKANNEVEGVVLKGVDANYDWSYFKNILTSGKTIDFSDSVQASKQIIISEKLAKRLNLKVGDDFLMYFIQEALRKRKFEIVGIYNTGVEEVDKTYVIGDISLIRKLNDWKKDEVGGYEIRINDFNRLDHFADELSNYLPPQIKTVSVKENYPIIFDWLSLLDVNAQVILILMLIVAVINMISALLIMILERTNMIGLLKALGETNWGVRKIFLYNALYLVGIGMFLGNIFGLGLGFLQQKTHFFKLDEASYYMKFIPVQFNVLDIVLINAATLGICLLVLLIPSMLVTKITPIKAIAFK